MICNFRLAPDTLKTGIEVAGKDVRTALAKAEVVLTKERIDQLQREERSKRKGRTIKYEPLPERDEIADVVAATCWGRP